jgi:hypothetical protein
MAQPDCGSGPESTGSDRVLLSRSFPLLSSGLPPPRDTRCGFTRRRSGCAAQRLGWPNGSLRAFTCADEGSAQSRAQRIGSPYSSRSRRSSFLGFLSREGGSIGVLDAPNGSGPIVPILGTSWNTPPTISPTGGRPSRWRWAGGLSRQRSRPSHPGGFARLRHHDPRLQRAR